MLKNSSLKITEELMRLKETNGHKDATSICWLTIPKPVTPTVIKTYQQSEIKR